jgi:hypothetical protein
MNQSEQACIHQLSRLAHGVAVSMTYGNFDDDASLLVEHPNGSMSGFVFINGTWKQLHEAEVFCKAYIMSRDDWHRRFVPPTMPDGVTPQH